MPARTTRTAGKVVHRLQEVKDVSPKKNPEPGTPEVVAPDAATTPAEAAAEAPPAATPAPAPVAPAPIPVAAPSVVAAAHARPRPRPWIVVTGAVVAAFLLMSLGACAALGIARHLAGGGLRGGYRITAPGSMRGLGGGRGFRGGGDRGFGQGRRLDRDFGQNPSQDTSPTTGSH